MNDELKTQEEQKSEEKSNNKKMMVTIIIAIAILLIFVAIYFGVTAYNNSRTSPADNGAVKTSAAPQVPTQSPAPIAEQPKKDDSNAAPKADGENAEGIISATPKEKAPDAEVATNVKYNHADAMKMAQDAAKTQFGEDAMVFPADDGVATMVEIDGVKRACYMFGADSMAQMAANNSLRGLYHFDANTGEIFDNGSGKMVKIN